MYRIKFTLPPLSTAYFLYSILALCLIYLGFEFYLIPREVLAADEFVFARHIFDYTKLTPYEDFPPYKTVLGYYLLSIPYYFSHGLLSPLFYIKDEIAIINAICIAITCVWASRIFNRYAVIMSLLAVIASHFFLIYSTDLRVDMLTSWFCLFAVFAILQKRTFLSGLLLGIAFLISQKALWSIFAINGAMALCWFAYPESKFKIRAFLKLNVAIILPVVLYILTWSTVASFSTILSSLFYEAYIQARIEWYQPIYHFCWQVTLNHGPFLFLFWPMTLIALKKLNPDDSISEQRVFILTLASLILFQFIHYKQPFPYNFVFTIPAFFVLYADFFTWYLARKKPTAESELNNGILALIASYSLFIILFLYFANSAPVYYLMVPLPILMALSLCNETAKYRFYRITTIGIILFISIVYPLLNAAIASLSLDGRYQQTMINLTAQLLQEEGDYVGGMPFLYSKDQPVAGLKNLIGPELDYITEPNDAVRPLLLDSLYLKDSTMEEILHDFDQSNVKVIIDNYRMQVIPDYLKNYIHQNYQHYYGSLFLYAPLISTKTLNFYLKFAGDYRIVTDRSAVIRIDGKSHHANEIITLKKGNHLTHAKRAYRLVLVPNIPKATLDPRFEADNWLYMIKAIVN